jgi:hypothetical protein
VSVLYVYYHIYRVLRPSAQRAHPLLSKTIVVERWLRAISLSGKRDFLNYVPSPDEEAFQQFVQFFWFIKVNDRPKADQLVSEGRRKRNLEAWFYPSLANEFLESPEDPVFSTPALSYWLRNPSKAHGLVPRKAVSYKLSPIKLPAIKGRQLTLLLQKVMSRKTTKIKKRMRNANRPFAIAKRPALAQPGFKKKRRLEVKARPGKRAAVDKGK